MSYDIPGFAITGVTAGDLSTSFLKFVKMGGATIVAVAAATDDAIGVLQNKPAAAGAAGTVMISGVTRVMTDAAIAAGVTVYLDATGQVSATAQVGAAVGVTVSASTATSLVASVLLKPLGAVS